MIAVGVSWSSRISNPLGNAMDVWPVKFVIAKSFARIHKTNLVNFGILPLNFKNAADYDKLEAGDELEIKGVPGKLKSGADLTVKNKTKGYDFDVNYDLSERQVNILMAGGLLNHTKANQE